jgi:hypothetical protein
LVILGMVLILSAKTALSATTSGIHINEVLFNPGDGAYQWVELKNSGTTAVNIGGYRITNEAGAWYTIPTALPAVPVGAFVVVVFDGAGSGGDDYDFSDKVATLHTGPELVNILGRTAGQCALYDSSPFKLYLPGILNGYQGTALSIFSPPTDFLLPAIPSHDVWSDVPKDRSAKVSKADIWSKRWSKSPAQGLGAGLSSAGPTILSFVAWGDAPGNRAANASHAGLWSPRWFKSLVRGLGVGDPSKTPNETIGLLPGSLTPYPDNWTLYQTGEVTKGGENPVPGISFYYPLSGATMQDTSFSIGWNPVRKATYWFQMANNINFSPLMVDQKSLTEAVYIPTTTVAPGTYYWRVKVLLAGRESLWSKALQIKSETLPTSLAGGEGSLGAPPSQKKYILPRIAWQLQHKDTTMLCLDGCELTGNEAWDQPHKIRGAHESKYCFRASMSMLVSYYGGKLSQDRITYQMFKGAAPELDLGHALTPPSWQAMDDALTWALGVSVPLQGGKPTFAQIKTWVDANQPSITIFLNPDGTSSHARVMDGYFEVGSYQKIHLLDPWTRDTGAGKDNGWVNYADDNIIAYYVGPAGPGGAPNVQSDEADLTIDSDGDLINAFDEKYRFHTDPTKGDTDGDQVMDRQEIKDYIFKATGAFDYRDPDMDWDTKRKELDPDNDGGGLIDGCEDINHTDSFLPSDDGLLSTTTISPTGTVYTSTPAYKWNAVCGAKSYWLQVDDSTGRLKIYKGYSASEVGCALGTGTCSLTSAISLADGNATWWIAACHLTACGPWSNARGFVVSGGPQDPIVGLWAPWDGGQLKIEERTTGSYDYVGKVTVQNAFWIEHDMKIGDEVWWLDKQTDGHYKGSQLWKGNFYWTGPLEVWITGNTMKDSTGKVVATKVQ